MRDYTVYVEDAKTSQPVSHAHVHAMAPSDLILNPPRDTSANTDSSGIAQLEFASNWETLVYINDQMASIPERKETSGRLRFAPDAKYRAWYFQGRYDHREVEQLIAEMSAASMKSSDSP